MAETADEIKRPSGSAGITDDTGFVVVAGQNSIAKRSSNGSAEEIRAEMAQTRSEMTGTLSAIQEKIRPDLLMDQAKDRASDLLEQAKEHAGELMDQAKDRATGLIDHAKDQASDTIVQARGAVRDATIGKVEHIMNSANESARGAGNSLFDTIKKNPLPAALAGIGIGWLWMSRRNGGSHQYQPGRNVLGHQYSGLPGAGAGLQQPGVYSQSLPERAGDLAGSVQSRVSETAGGLQDKVGETAEQLLSRVGETAGQVGDLAGQLTGQTQERWEQFGDQAQVQATRAQGQASRMLQDYPLAVGAVAIGVGAAIGFLVPETAQEGRLMGGVRDQLFEQASSVIQDTGQKVQQIVESSDQSAQLQ